MFPTEPRLLQQQYGFGDLRIASVPLNVPVRTGWEWISLDVSGLRSGKNLNPDNDLRRSLAFGGSPWKVEVERVEGIELSPIAWEAIVVPFRLYPLIQPTSAATVRHFRGSFNISVRCILTLSMVWRPVSVCWPVALMRAIR